MRGAGAGGAAILVLLLAVPAGAGRAGEAEATFLHLPPGPREAALGGGGVAVTDDARALWANPAGLAWNAAENIAADHGALFVGLDADHLAYAHPTSDRSTWGVALGRWAAEGIERTEVAAGGGAATGLGTYDAETLLGATGFAYLVRPDLAVGVAAKVLRDRLDGTGGTVAAADLGVRYDAPRAGINVGLTLQNVGADGPQGGRLPLIVRAGAAYGRLVRRADYFLLSGEAAFGRGRPATFRLGGEYWLFGLLALRAGFDESLREAGGGLTLGLGVRYRNLTLDYAATPTDDLGTEHRLGLSVSFGRERVRPGGRYDRP